jgi:hypothetical protein
MGLPEKNWDTALPSEDTAVYVPTVLTRSPIGSGVIDPT